MEFLKRFKKITGETIKAGVMSATLMTTTSVEAQNYKITPAFEKNSVSLDNSIFLDEVRQDLISRGVSREYIYNLSNDLGIMCQNVGTSINLQLSQNKLLQDRIKSINMSNVELGHACSLIALNSLRLGLQIPSVNSTLGLNVTTDGRYFEGINNGENMLKISNVLGAEFAHKFQRFINELRPHFRKM